MKFSNKEENKRKIEDFIDEKQIKMGEKKTYSHLRLSGSNLHLLKIVDLGQASSVYAISKKKLRSMILYLPTINLHLLKIGGF